MSHVSTEVANEEWTEIIFPKTNLLDLKLKQVWAYRDLLALLVRRDFVATYKQTVLGPVWFFLQPILTSLTYILIFGRIAKIPTDGLPMILFYLSGIILWNYFSDCLNKTSTVFKDNSSIFGKVYFPRLIMPLSIVVSNLVRLSIQFSLFFVLWLWYFLTGANLHPNVYVFLVPYIIVIMATIGLGGGMIISALTTKYRDLVFLLTFGVQLLMYATPVIYSLSSISSKYAWLIKLNPLTSIIETFRYGFMGSGSFGWELLSYSTLFAICLLVVGTIVFNRVEKSFMDTV